LDAGHPDPAAEITSLDQRRLDLERSVDSPADVIISITGQGEGNRLGSVNPFSHAALVVDFPQESEEQNTLILAHELAMLFGAAADLSGSANLMSVPPRNSGFTSRTAALIRELRDYNFAAGIGPLKDKWQHKAVQAIAESYNRPAPKPRAHAYVTVAMALAAERYSADAVPVAREAVKADPQSLDARQALAHALMDDMQPAAAIQELREAIRLFPNNAPLHGSLGSVLGSQAETEGALSELRTAEALDPGNANYPIAVGQVLVAETGLVDQAMAEFQKAAQLDPRSVRAQYWVHRMDDLSSRARADLEADLLKERATPQDPTVHYQVGVDQARLGHQDDARKEFQKTVELDPHNGRALADLAAMEYYHSDYPSARRHLNAARAAGFEPPMALMTALSRKEQAKAQDPPAAK
jgi:Tfp pilus assembly protein PilF